MQLSLGRLNICRLMLVLDDFSKNAFFLHIIVVVDVSTNVSLLTHTDGWNPTHKIRVKIVNFCRSICELHRMVNFDFLEYMIVFQKLDRMPHIHWMSNGKGTAVTELQHRKTSNKKWKCIPYNMYTVRSGCTASVLSFSSLYFPTHGKLVQQKEKWSWRAKKCCRKCGKCNRHNRIMQSRDTS